VREFQDKFTLDGLVMPPKGVTLESVGKVAKLVAEGMRGSYVAEAQLKESLMSGDLASSVAHFMNVITIPQLPEDHERPVAAIAGFRTVPDFRPATLFSIFGKLGGPGVTADGSAPRVPQGTPYPVATISGAESAYSKLGKRGNRVNWDFEDFVNDTLGVLNGIPAELQEVALQTEWMEVGEAVIKATTVLPAVTLPDGTTVPTNAPLSANAIFAAIQALAQRTVNGAKRKIGTLSGYNVIVPVGQKVFADYAIHQALNIVTVLPGTSGGAVYGPPDNTALNTVTVIEHEAVTGTKWYLMPKPGAYRRPVIDVLRLRGYETPQLRVKTEGGDGFSFDTDSASIRLRMVTGAALWSQDPVVYSKGTGAA
jgi:hypothetical protein